MLTTRNIHEEVRRHASAARAFHTGLVADTHRRLRVLQQMAQHINVLRHQASGHADKLSATEAACRHLKTLEKLDVPWRETYLDLRRRLRQIRVHLRRLAKD